MKKFWFIAINDIKCFSRQILPLLSIMIALIFVFIAKEYSFERGKSTLYVNISGDTATAEFLKIQAQKDKSTVVLDSKEKLIRNMSINPFSYGLDIDTENNKVDIIIKGYESEKVINNIMIMSAFLMNNSQDFSDIDINYLPSKVITRKQIEKQIIPIFVYLTVSTMPMLIAFLFMLEQKEIMIKNIDLMFCYRMVVTSKIMISAIFHMVLSLLIALISCKQGFDILGCCFFAFLSSFISSCIGILLSAVYNSIYNSLKAMLAISILIVLPIWNLAFGKTRYILFLDFYMLPYKAIRNIILYKDSDTVHLGLIAYPAIVMLILFIFTLMFYKKIDRWRNIRQ